MELTQIEAKVIYLALERTPVQGRQQMDIVLDLMGRLEEFVNGDTSDSPE